MPVYACVDARGGFQVSLALSAFVSGDRSLTEPGDSHVLQGEPEICLVNMDPGIGRSPCLEQHSCPLNCLLRPELGKLEFNLYGLHLFNSLSLKGNKRALCFQLK